jgi:hypothetical protein
MSGLMRRSLAEDVTAVNNTLITWSQRSVRMILCSSHRRLIIITTVLQPKSGICVCFSHTKVSLSSSTRTKKIANEPHPCSVPLLNIKNNMSTAQHGSSTSRKLGIAFGSILAVGSFTCLLILLYLILYHRLRARARSRSWKRHLNLRKLYLDRRSHHKSDNNNDVSSNTDRPITMVGSEEENLSLNGGGDTLTDPDPFAVDFKILPLDRMSKSTTTAKSKGVRRENGWRNFEDYVYL